MGKQLFTIKGMSRDLAPSKSPNQYAYEIRNLRLTAQEDSTLLVLTTEKGNTEYRIIENNPSEIIDFNIIGLIVGYCTINRYLVIFTHAEGQLAKDYIYRLEEKTDSDAPTMLCTVIFDGVLGFSNSTKVDTLGVYENESIQKVYWIDGEHSLRFINIVSKNLPITDIHKISSVPNMQLKENVTVERTSLYGNYNAGTLQYFFYYYNKNGAQSSLFYQSPLQYSSFSRRGGNAEETIGNSFKLTVKNIDRNFDYIRVVSAYRSSQNGTPVYRLVQDVPINDNPSIQELVEDYTLERWNGTVSGIRTDQRIEVIAKEYTAGSIGRNKVVPLGMYIKNEEGNQEEYSILLNRPPGSMGNGTSIEVYLYTGRYDAQGNERVERYIAGEQSAMYADWYSALIKVSTAINDNGIRTYSISLSDTNKAWYSISYKRIKTSKIETIPNSISIIDNGFGEVLDDFSLMQSYDIVPKSFERKDNTLFLGNYSLPQSNLEEEEALTLKEKCFIRFSYKDALDNRVEGDVIAYQNQLQLDNTKITSFKGGEWYHFGLILQDNFGNWTSVIDLGEKQNPLYPKQTKDNIYLVGATIQFDEAAYTILQKYSRMKVVMIEQQGLQVIAQGVLCPTTFNKNRRDNNPYAQSSWLFRTVVETTNPKEPKNKLYASLNSDRDKEYMSEIQGANENELAYYIDNINDFNETDMFLDGNLLSFHSPDLQFERVTSFPDNVSMRIIGYAPITSGSVNHLLQLKSTTRGDGEYDYINNINYYAIDRNANEILPNSYSFFDKQWDTSDDSFYYHQVFLWQRAMSMGSFGPSSNSTTSNNGMVFSQPDVKSIFFQQDSYYTRYLSKETPYTITIPKICGGLNNATQVEADNNNQLYPGNKLYIANVNSILTVKNSYSIYGYKVNDSANKIALRNSDCRDGIPMKYKSDTHSVFALKSMDSNTATIQLLPNMGFPNFFDVSASNTIKFPEYTIGPISNVINLSNCNVSIEALTKVGRYKENSRSVHYATAVEEPTHTIEIVINNRSLFETEVSSFNPEMTVRVSGNLRVAKGSFIGITFTANSNEYIDVTCEGILNDIWEVNAINDAYTELIPISTSYLESQINKAKYEGRIPLLRSMTPAQWAAWLQTSSTPEYSYYDLYSMIFYYVDTSTATSTSSGTIRFYKYYLYKLNKAMEMKEIPWWLTIAKLFTLGLYNYETTYVYESTIVNHAGTFSIAPRMGTYVPPQGDTPAQQPELEPQNLNKRATPTQETININSNYPYIWVAELYTNHKPNYNLKTAKWITASNSVPIDYFIEANIGDTYYQKYDCLKTSPNSLEDVNQVTNVFSFMCETKVNIDGRWDSHRGDNATNILQDKFNLLNKVYTQEDNLFSFAYLDRQDLINKFPNQITWSLSKVYGEEIDSWTKINLVSTLDLDGLLGEIRDIKLWNDNLLVFQDKGISRILYKEQTTIATNSGVPVEIANSGKVDGSHYVSNQIGCKNKDSIQVTQEGIYFVDENTKEIYKMSKGLESLSKGKGFNAYLYNNPYISTEKTFYDPKLRDVYFQFGGECLVYNEQLSEFTSFLDYTMDFMFPFQDSLVAIKNNKLWKQFAGNYLSLFGEDKSYSIDLIASENPTEDKIFSNVEFRAEVLDDSIQEPYSQRTYSDLNILPFTKIRAWNEYQDTGEVDFERTIRRNTGSNLAQKFRIWRGDIPRAETNPLERIRNPWVRIKLFDDGSNKKTIIHDIAITYF